jgi:hypothetical protein
MERIEFTYTYHDEDGAEKAVTQAKRDENGIHDYDICEMFLDFMRSVGFSEENVFRYFNQ